MIEGMPMVDPNDCKSQHDNNVLLPENSSRPDVESLGDLLAAKQTAKAGICQGHRDDTIRDKSS
jgi:hypothetical protein